MIASKYANRDIGRRNLEALVAATVRATLDEAPREEHAEYHAAMEEISADAIAAYRELVYETPGFVDYFRASTPIREIAELNIGSRPGLAQALAAHRGPARDPVGVLVGAVPRDAAGLVRVRQRRRGLHREARRRGAGAARARCGASGPSSAPCSPTSRCCSPRRTSSVAARYKELRARTQRLADAIFARIRARARPHGEGASSRSPRTRASSRPTRRSRAPSATASPTSTRSTTCRSSCSSATAPATPPTRSTAASTSPSTASPRGCATPADRFGVRLRCQVTPKARSDQAPRSTDPKLLRRRRRRRAGTWRRASS